MVVAMGAESPIRYYLEGGYVELSREGVSVDGEAIVSGLASTPAINSWGHSVVQGAFAESIAQRGLTGPRGVKFLLNHRADQPAGRILRLEYVEEGLFIEARMNTRIGYVRDFYEAAVDNGGFSFSTGAYYDKIADVVDERGRLLYQKVLKGDLIEVSAVVFPANEEAQMFVPGNAVKASDAASAIPGMLVAAGMAQDLHDARRKVQMMIAHDAGNGHKDCEGKAESDVLAEIRALIRELGAVR